VTSLLSVYVQRRCLDVYQHNWVASRWGVRKRPQHESAPRTGQHEMNTAKGDIKYDRVQAEQGVVLLLIKLFFLDEASRERMIINITRNVSRHLKTSRRLWGYTLTAQAIIREGYALDYDEGLWRAMQNTAIKPKDTV
jgi:hypothetical protein